MCWLRRAPLLQVKVDSVAVMNQFLILGLLTIVEVAVIQSLRQGEWGQVQIRGALRQEICKWSFFLMGFVGAIGLLHQVEDGHVHVIHRAAIRPFKACGYLLLA